MDAVVLALDDAGKIGSAGRNYGAAIRSPRRKWRSVEYRTRKNGGDSRGNRSGESEKGMFDASRSVAGADGACDAGGEDRRQLGSGARRKEKSYYLITREYCLLAIEAG